MVLGFPKPLECTDSSAYQLLDLSSRTDPLGDGLNLSSSLVLDVAFSQLGPLSLLLCFIVLCVPSSSQDSGLSVFVSPIDSLSNYLLMSLFMALRPSVPRLFCSSSTSVDSPFADALGVPCPASS